jgi:cytochrome P450
MSVYAEATERPAHVPASHVVDFDLYNPPNIENGFFEAWKSLHRPGTPDLVWTPHNGGHWIATRSKIINDVLTQYELFSSRVTIVPKAAGEQIHLIPVHIDPPFHRPYRMLLNEGLSAPKAVARIEPRIRGIVIELIESFRLKGSCNFTVEFAELMPIRVFLDLVDLPIEDAPTLKRWADQVTRPDGSMTLDEVRAALNRYLEPYVDERLGGTGEDMLSLTINKSVDGKSLTREEALAVCTLVMIAGLDTTVSLLGFTMLFLARNPARRLELIDDPSMIPSAVEEFIRRFPVSLQAREVRYDMEYAGVHLKRGEMVLAGGQLASLDERENENPMEVNFHRSSIEHATFGKGIHMCAGQNLARTELRITIEEWLRRIPEFSVKPGAKIEYEGGVAAVVCELPLVWNSGVALSG